MLMQPQEDTQTALIKDQLFWLLSQVAIVGERAYMAEHHRVRSGFAYAHVEIFWAHSIFELLRLKTKLRIPHPNDGVARVGSV